MTRHLLCGFVALGLPVAAASAQTTLSLDEAIELGLSQNRGVANAAMQVDKAEEATAVARTRRFPSFKVEAQGSQLLRPVDLTFARGVFGTFPGIGPVPALDTDVTTPARFNVVFNAQLQQPLTQLVKVNLNVHLNEAVSDEEREQLRDARLALVDQIRRAYYAIAQTRSALASNAQTLTLLNELDRVVARRVSQQVALKVDGLTVQSRIAQTELARLTLANTLESQKEQLNQLIGRDIRADFDVDDIPDVAFEDVDLESAQARAIDARPDVKRARIKVQEAELARKLAKADYIPDVGLAVSYLSPLNIDGAPQQIATAAIQAQWEPFDWGRKRRAVATRALEMRQAQNGARDSEERARLDVNNKFRRLEQARASLRAARAAGDAARETARLRLTQYDVDAVLVTDVLQAQASLAETDHQVQEALVAFWTARAEFERALGEE
jgi:outer membrane protein TolC